MEQVVLSPSQVAAEEVGVHNPGEGEVEEGPEFQLQGVVGEGVVWVAPCREAEEGEGVVWVVPCREGEEGQGVGLHQVEGAEQGEVEGDNDPYLGVEGEVVVVVGVVEGQVRHLMN